MLACPGIRRYEAEGQQPSLQVAVAIAAALKISLSDLAGMPSHRVKLAGEWWASWQTFRDGAERIATQQVVSRMTSDLCELVITAPDPEWLLDLTRRLVAEGLCASAQLHPDQDRLPMTGTDRREGESRAPV